MLSNLKTTAHSLPLCKRERARRGARMMKLAFAGIAGTLMTASFVVAPTAQAAVRDGGCDTGEFCLYFNSDNQGSLSDFGGSVADYGSTKPTCYVFKGAGADQGECVKNHAASVWNNTSVPVTVYYNSSYSGANQTIAPGGRANLDAT